MTSLSARLMKRFFRRLPWFGLGQAVLAVAGLALALNVFLDSQTLAPRDAARYELGSFSSTTRVIAGAPVGDQRAARLQDALAGSTLGAKALITTPDFPVVEIADDGLGYAETDWSASSLSQRYAVTRGRFPAKPGEVLVVDAAARPGQKLAVFGSGHDLTVVGVGRGRFFRDAAVVAAPGTWSWLPAAASEELGGVNARVEVLVPAGVTRDSVSAELKKSAPTASLARSLEQNPARSRADAAREAATPWVSRSPLVFWLPILLLTPLSVVLTTLSMMRRIRPAVRSLRHEGMRARAAVWVVVGPVLCVMVVAALVGALAGAVLGWLAAVLGARGPTSPMPVFDFPWSGLVAVSAGVLLGAALSLDTVSRRLQNNRTRPEQVAGSTGGEGASVRDAKASRWHVHHVVALICACAGVYLVLSMRTPWQALLLVCVAVVFCATLSVDLVRLFLRMLPSARNASQRLARRLSVTYLQRSATYVALLIVGMGVAIGMLSSISSAMAADRARQGDSAPPGLASLGVDSAPTLPIDSRMMRAVRTVPELARQRPVQLWSTGRLEQMQGVSTMVSYATTTTNAGIVRAVESIPELERLWQRKLIPAERRTLQRGGVLVIDPEVMVRRKSLLLVNSDNGRKIAEVSARRSDPPAAAWDVFVPGYMLTSTARELQLPLVAGSVIFTNVSSSQSDQARAALLAAGVNPESWLAHMKPPPVLPAPALAGALLGLLVLALSAITFVSRAQIRGMRGWVAQLQRVGVPRKWVRSVLVRQHAFLTVTGIVVGGLAGAIPLYSAQWLLPGFIVEIPWNTIAGLLVVLAAIAVGTVWFAVRGLVPREEDWRMVVETE